MVTITDNNNLPKGSGKRQSWIDVFKGISILLVILQHCLGVDELGKFLLSFHMPLFFWISGYTMGSKNYNFRDIKFKGLHFLKYQIVVGITNCLWYFFILQLILKKTIDQRWADYFLTWFLPTMFYILILHTIFNRILKDKYSKLIGLLSCAFFAIGGGIIPQFDVGWDYIHITKAPLAYSFFLLGCFCRQKKFDEHIRGISLVRKHVYILVLVIVVIFFERLNTPVLWYCYDLGNIFYFTISSVAGILLVLTASQVILRFGILEFMGKQSIVIYSVQFLVYRIIMSILNRIVTIAFISASIGFIISAGICYFIAYISLKIKVFNYS